MGAVACDTDGTIGEDERGMEGGSTIGTVEIDVRGLAALVGGVGESVDSTVGAAVGIIETGAGVGVGIKLYSKCWFGLYGSHGQ